MQKSALFPPLISQNSDDELELIVIIPSYKEPNLLKTLESLSQNAKVDFPVEILILINASENASAEIKQFNEEKYRETQSWISENIHENIVFHLLLNNELPKKHAGVGLARKILMDEACYRFEKLGKPNGVIVNLDADCLVEPNYLYEIRNFFHEKPNCPAVSIHYEHILDESLSKKNREAIVNYELHLRYYVQALRFADFPLAFHTIGSSMACRASMYQKLGGMNKRKAGEDFYFLQKFIPFSAYADLVTTTVLPSSRSSDRVPFGTGKAVSDFLEDESKKYETYDFQTFVDLKVFMKNLPKFYKSEFPELIKNLPKSVQEFLQSFDFEQIVSEAKSQANAEKSFLRRIFIKFNNFTAMKYAHFVRDHFYPNSPTNENAILLAQAFNLEVKPNISSEELLFLFRKYERENPKIQTFFND